MASRLLRFCGEGIVRNEKGGGNYGTNLKMIVKPKGIEEKRAST